MTPDRAWILLPSGRRLDLLSPDPRAWTDDDLATGLSRTYRWARLFGLGSAALRGPAQPHRAGAVPSRTGTRLAADEALRELLHDAVEALMGGWDPITPLKPHLGDGFARLVGRLQAAIDTRYALPSWTDESHARHKHADRLTAASEAYHVVGWSLLAIRDDLGITLLPAAADPLRRARRPAWEPWAPKIAAQRFLGELQALSAAGSGKADGAENPACRPSDASRGAGAA